MKTVELRYGVSFGKGDSSDWMEWEVELTDEEAVAYDNAIANNQILDNVAELQDALNRAYKEIEETEISNMSCEEYVMECQGEAEMDTLELNELVKNRDPYALEFFGLLDADDEEIEDWDADFLDEIPTIAEFVQDFEPYSPFDEGWSLYVEFVDPNW